MRKAVEEAEKIPKEEIDRILKEMGEASRAVSEEGKNKQDLVGKGL